MRRPATLLLLGLLGLFALLPACGPDGGGSRPNVLLLLADDIGVEALRAYGEGDDLPATPNLDRLAREGVLFRNVWSNPLCSSTRATVQTGRYGFRTGVGGVIRPDGPALPVGEVTLPEMLDAGGAYDHAAFGKWHLGNDSVGGVQSPNLAGYGHFAGTLSNLVGMFSYDNWIEIVDGETRHRDDYATTATVDAALAWLADRREPWFAYVAFHAAHLPLHRPPADLHSVSFDGVGPPTAAPEAYFRAAVEALDTEIGRLLDGLGPGVLERTTVVFLTDNGTSELARTRDPDEPERGKGTLFEPGIRVPLIVRGPPVGTPGSSCDALVNTTDLFATIAELAGVDPADALPAGAALDSVSLVPLLADPAAPSLRRTIFAEYFRPPGAGDGGLTLRAIRNRRFKLVHQVAPPHMALYDLESDPAELEDLLASGTLEPHARRNLNILRRELQVLLASR